MTEDLSHLIYRSQQRGDVRRFKSREGKETLIDSEGDPGAPLQVVDELLNLLTQDLITQEQYNSGIDFRNDFQRAGYVGIKAANLHRTGASWSDPTLGRMDCSKRVHAALRAVGGLFSSHGLVAWNILGEERSFKEFLEYQGAFFKDPKKVLIEVLEILEE